MPHYGLDLLCFMRWVLPWASSLFYALHYCLHLFLLDEVGVLVRDELVAGRSLLKAAGVQLHRAEAGVHVLLVVAHVRHAGLLQYKHSFVRNDP